jgi:Xaa-Pro aminopeptidase
MRPSASALLTRCRVPAFLISDLLNIRYITGLDASSALLLATKQGYVLYIDPRYAETARQDVRKTVRIRDIDRLGDDLKRHKTCGFEEDNVTVARLRRWKTQFPNTKFVRIGPVLDDFRRTKDVAEQSLIRKAIRITEQLLARLPGALRPGVTERAVGALLEVWARELGADELAFPPIVAFGPHTSRPHHHPTDRVLKKNDIVQIDVGARYKGYCADMAKVFFAGKPTARQLAVHSAVLEAKDAVIAAAAPGTSVHALCTISADILKRARLPALPHALGHGVGLDVHEGVTLSERRKDVKLQKNEAIAIEPGAYFAGKFGMREEETIIIHKA